VQTQESFLEWLRPRTQSSAVAQLDPYSDGALEASAQEEWLAALKQEQQALRLEARQVVEKRPDLPADVSARQAVLTVLVDRELMHHPWNALLTELVTVLELALEQEATIRLLGD
jgi:hypothetical protein